MATCSSCGRESAEGFAFCPFCGAALAAAEAVPASEVRKTVTVLFCDVTGSTALGERLDPETLGGVMGRYFDEMERAIARHGGTVEKFIGDAVMAVFGVPTLHEDDALRAVRAAADMREAMHRLNKELERDHGVSLAARIGVNTGEVVARQEGGAGDQRLVTGDAVNVAARLEQAARPGEVLLGEPTLRLVRDAVQAEPVEPLALKGKTESVPAYRLELVHPHAAGVARRLDSPMVGRARQLRQLSEAFETAVDERVCYLFTVLGAPGVGKSRLTEEFLAGVADEATVVRGRCLSYGQGITFFPIVEILAQLTGTGEIDVPNAARDRLAELVGAGPEAGIVADRLLAVTGVEGSTTGTDELFWAVRLLFESVSRRRPLVVVVDDIHWAEPTLLDLIEHLADWSRDAPMLLVCPARPELLDLRTGWAGGKLHATTILLEPLAEDECEELIANLLGASGLDETITRRIAQAAEGNPLFVEQMLAMLVDDGHLRESDGRWVAAEALDEVAVPPTVSALLTARLDRLSPSERRVVERAAVEGKEFHAGSVAALLDEGERPDMAAHLRTLVRRELVRPHGSELPGEEGYRFRHQLIRDAAYDAIPKRTRADLHRRFAEWLSMRAAGTTEFDEFVGYHLERSYVLRAELGPVDEEGLADARRAAELLSAAGARADARYDFHAAKNLMARARELLPRPNALRVRTSIALARVLLDLSELIAAVEVANEAVADAKALGDPSAVTLGELRSGIVGQQLGVGLSPEQLLELALRATVQFESEGEWANAAVAWEAVSSANWAMARWAAMPPALERAIELLGRTGQQSRRIALGLGVLSAKFYGPTPVTEAVRFTREYIDEAAAFPIAAARAQAVLCALLGFLGEFEAAWRLADTVANTIDEIGNRAAFATFGFALAPLGRSSGRLEPAERHLRRTIRVLEGTGDRGWTGTLTAMLAINLFEQGRLDEAETFAAMSRETALPEDTNAQVFWRSITAQLLSTKGEHEDAIRLAREAVELNRGTDELNHLADFLVSLAWVAERAGERDEAESALREAVDCYERKGNVVGIANARERLTALTGP